MKKIEKYTGATTYMYPSGALATPESVQSKYPAVSVFTHIAETDEAGEVLFALQNLSAMRAHYGIDSALSEEDAIAAIETAVNTVPEVSTDPTTDERIAASLEFLALSSLPDEV